MLDGDDPEDGSGGLDRRMASAVARHAVVYPAVAAGGAALLGRWRDVAFGTTGFGLFVTAVTATGFAAFNTSPSIRAVRSGGRSIGEHTDPGAYWTESFVLRMVVFDLGLAAVLAVHALWFTG